MTTYSGWIADIVNGRLFAGSFSVQDGRIVSIEESAEPPAEGASVFVPGFVDAHVHIESAMLPPSEYARAAVKQGTLAAVADPHEIANVMGLDGVYWMLEDAARRPFVFAFGAPSCVPSTPFETAGAVFGPKEVGQLLDDARITHLAEMMNFPGVIGNDERVAAILAEAKKRNKPIDGHSPSVLDEGLSSYINAGISTDHEVSSLEEGRQRVRQGMHVIIREGSAARNFETLWPLMKESPERVMLCHDDFHPDGTKDNAMNILLARGVAKGIDPMTMLKIATLNPVRHYGLKLGLLQTGDRADFVELADLKSFEIKRCFIEGQCVVEHGVCLWPHLGVKPVNRFKVAFRSPAEFQIPAVAGKKLRVIGAVDGELYTHAPLEAPLIEHGEAVSDTKRDLLKIAVVNRYEQNAPIALGFVRGFGLKQGALATSVAHDSHNIVAVGVDDLSLCHAINAVIAAKGGLCVVGQRNQEEALLPLPIAGLMSDLPEEDVERLYKHLNTRAAELGCPLHAPFMTLSFMALPVIPSLKLTDKGLFDVNSFSHVPLWE